MPTLAASLAMMVPAAAETTRVVTAEGRTIDIDLDPELGQVALTHAGEALTITVTPRPGAALIGLSLNAPNAQCSSDFRTCRVAARTGPQALTARARFTAGTAYLLVHGMAADTNTWYNLVLNHFGRSCGRVKRAVAIRPAARPAAVEDWREAISEGQLWTGQTCFALQAGTRHGYDRGDGMSYQELGDEIANVVGQIRQAYPGLTRVVIVAHSRGGLAARAAFAHYPQRMGAVKGLLTVGTPHLGSPMGRGTEWLRKNPPPTQKSCWGENAIGETERVYCTTPGPNGLASEADRDQGWRLTRFIERTGDFDMAAPTVERLSYESPTLAALNRFRLPGGVNYAVVSSQGLNLGRLAGINGQSIITFDIFGIGLPPLAPPMPRSAQQHVLSGPSGNCTPASCQGDGIVPVNSQRAIPAPALVGSKGLWKIYHMDQHSINPGYEAIAQLLPLL